MVGGEAQGLSQFGDVVDAEVMQWFIAPVSRGKLFHHTLALARAVRYDVHHQTAVKPGCSIDRCFMDGNGFSDESVLALVGTVSADGSCVSRLEEAGSLGEEEEEEELRRLRSVYGVVHAMRF